jgi:hypothetical protein
LQENNHAVKPSLATNGNNLSPGSDSEPSDEDSRGKEGTDSRPQGNGHVLKDGSDSKSDKNAPSGRLKGQASGIRVSLEHLFGIYSVLIYFWLIV